MVKQANTSNRWHEFDVVNIAQGWVSGSYDNYGLTVRAPNVPLGNGGAIYQASEDVYNDEIQTRPKLVLSYGRPGAHLHYPKKIYSTGAVLNWNAYVDPNPNSTADDAVEYQVHRSTKQVFQPSESTLIAPLPTSARWFTDTTARPTAPTSPDPFGQEYHYMIATKTRDGQVVAGPTQLARLPKAGRVIQMFHISATATTLSSAQPSTNLNLYEGREWLSVGIKSSTYGTTRSVVKFDNLHEIPAGARIVDADMGLWGFYNWSSGTGAQANVHKLTRGFTETQATWNKANSTTSWTNSGGDYVSTPLSTMKIVSDSPSWYWWEVDSAVQGWIDNPASNHGLIVRLNDTTVEERVLFNSDAADETQLRPNLVVTYVQPTAESTYYAPDTPSMRMIPGDIYKTKVTLTNTTTSTWKAADYKLSYKWALPDGTDATTEGNRLETALPADIPPLGTVEVEASLKTPIQSAAGNKREQFVLAWDLRNTTTGTWLSATSGAPPPLKQNVTVEDPTSDQLGLEKYYSYTGAPTGAGSNVLVNQYAGNTVWSYDAFSNPGRGMNTFLRMTYNSQDTSASSMGYGWSMAASGLVRVGSHLDLAPLGQDYPTTITLPDGDGTSHTFDLNKHDSADPAVWTWDHPAGVHLYFQRSSGDDDARRWVATRPDRTKFYFDDEGWLTAVADRNGNEQTYTYTERVSQNQPRKFLAYVTDPAGRQSLTLDYYTTDDTNNPKIIDNVKTVTDISGRTVALSYDTKGLMTTMVDGSGDANAKTFTFGYDATQGGNNIKLVKIGDPRSNALPEAQRYYTNLAYYTPPGDPMDKRELLSITDRLGDTTTLTYSDLDGQAGNRRGSTVTDAEGHKSTYELDGYGRPDVITNAKNETTRLDWDADNNVIKVTEPNGAVATWVYDPKTGYPTEIRDAESVRQNVEPTRLGYQTGLGGHTAELTSKTTPEGREWVFGYDPNGNVKTVTDPKGVATATVGDFQTSYTYDTKGQLLTATDANSNATNFSLYHDTGYPQKTTDALGNATSTVFDDRGNVTKITDAENKSTTVGYDVFGRPGQMVTPRDTAAGKFITTPAPTYDRNDNVRVSTAPNGAVSTADYDNADQLSAATAPKDTATGPERRTTYTYDKVGNLKSETQPLGTATATDPNDYVTTYGYDAIYQLRSVTNAAGHMITYDYNDVGDMITVTDPRKNATADTADFTTKYTYDHSHRPLTVTDADGNVTTTGYDKDGKVTTTTDAAGNTTTYVLDERAMVGEVRVPHKTGVVNTTKFDYDEVGNQTRVITPRGALTAATDDFVHTTVYDELNRPKERWSPYDPGASSYNTPDKTFFSYDKVGNLAKVSAPPSHQQSVRNDTTYSYFDDGLVRTSTDPWDIVTSYDYNDLGQQSSRTLRAAGGTGSPTRSMSWTYYPDGKSHTRSDSGAPVGKHVAIADNSDVGNLKTVGTWIKSANGTNDYGIDYHYTAAGTGAKTFTWTPVIPADGSYEVFVWHPESVTGAATNAKYTVNTGTTSTVKTVNQATGGGTWKSLGSYTLSEGNKAKVSLSDQADGTVLADAVKLVRAATETDNESKSFEHVYDINGNLKALTDKSTNQDSSSLKVNTYAMDYNGLNQLSQVVEKLNNTVKNTTTYTYNPNGDPLTRGHDRQNATFDYNNRDLVEKVTNTETGKSPKVTNYGYTVRGLLQTETKPNGNIVTHTYNQDASLATQIEKKSSGVLVAQHLIDYNANGHRIRDDAKIQNADDQTKYLHHIYAYGYDPQDRIAKVEKKTPTGTVAETETYTHDANSNVINQNVGNAEINYSYDRNRLQTAAVVGGATAHYNYDPFGRLNTVVAGGTDKILESYKYDGFDRTLEHKSTNDAGVSKTSTYKYDPLDRTQAKTADGKTTTFDYLGLTDKVVAEEVAGALSRTYTYDAWGQRLGQIKHDTATPQESYYGYNVHSDVETLTTEGGGTRATYGYTAYGNDDKEAFTGIDKPSVTQPDAEPYNFYRYNGKRWDANSKSYDMGFRDYSPGLNRFLTRDTYNGALADLGLGADPWTGNRYAFTGGNPISRIEHDGHRPICGGGTSGDCGYEGDAWKSNPEKAQSISNKRDAAPARKASQKRKVIGGWLAMSCATSSPVCSHGDNGLVKPNSLAPMVARACLDIKQCTTSEHLDELLDAAFQDAISEMNAYAQGTIEVAGLVAGGTSLPALALRLRRSEDGPRQLPQDVNVSRKAPDALELDRPVGKSQIQNDFKDERIRRLRKAGAENFRVNQQQVNYYGERVGLNRPDLQYDLNGVRHYEEFDTMRSTRGWAHLHRIMSNDQIGVVLLWRVG